MSATHATHLRFRAPAVLMLCTSLLSASLSVGETVTDVYNFRMCLYVPRVYDNTQSLGYRKYQRQIIKGLMLVSYDVMGNERPSVAFTNLYNVTHKVNGNNVTYNAVTDTSVPVRVNVVGDNATKRFRTPSVSFAMVAEPSYIIGEPNEDNTLYVSVSGFGRNVTTNGVNVMLYLQGSVAGTIGCGCTDYGHTSPTRVMGATGPTDIVEDVASVHGIWRARWIQSKSRR